MVGIAHRTYSTTFANDTPRIALATFSAMKARRTGLVVEWVVEEDARRILLSSPSGAGRERSIIGSCRSDGTRPGAWDGACPSPRSQSGMRAGDDGRWRRRSDGTRPGARDVAFPFSRSQSGMRAGDDGRWRRRSDGSQLGMRAGDADHQRRRSDGTRPGAWDGACPSPRSQPGTRAGDADDEIRGYERDEPLRSVLGRAHPEQGPP